MSLDLALRALVGRETRRFTAQVVEARADGEGGLTLDGYASVFDVPFTVNDWLGSFTEVVRPGAFTETLASGDDVRLLINHEGLPLARTKSGTLALEEDDHGLHVVASLEPSDPDVAAIVPKLRRADLDQMSIGFEVLPGGQEWSPDWAQRDLTALRLWDVSVVTFPASPTTTVGLRDALIAVRSATGLDLERFAYALAGAVAEQRAGKVLSAANEDLLVSARDSIDTVLASAGADRSASHPTRSREDALRRLALLDL